MKKIVLSQHVSLDGFIAGPNGEMDWIKYDDGIFELVTESTNTADTALYGRVTYELMDNYWPGAVAQPTASKFDIEHSTWFSKVNKIVLSKTMKSNGANKVTVIADNVVAEIEKLKNQPGSDILMFGSPRASHTLMEYNLIDEYWLFVNPIILGEGIPVFANIKNKTALNLITSKSFANGVTGLHYTVI